MQEMAVLPNRKQVRLLFDLNEFMGGRAETGVRKRNCYVGLGEKSQNLIKLAKKRTVEVATSFDGFPQTLWKTCG
jgi:hypothetical protein